MGYTRSTIQVFLEVDSSDYSMNNRTWFSLFDSLQPDENGIVLLRPRMKISERAILHNKRMEQPIRLDPVSLSGLTQIDCSVTFMVMRKSSDCHNPQRHEISKNETSQPKEVIK